MKPSSLWTLVLVVVCALSVVGALGWASVHALRLEDRELKARSEAHLQESIRLALWRMDSAINAIVGRESVRPYFQYAAFYPAGRAYTSMWEEVRPGEFVVPSPLLASGDRFVRLYFQRDEKGAMTSPQAPAGNMRDLAESMYVSSDRVIAAQERLDELSQIFSGERVAERVIVAPLATSNRSAGLEEEKAAAAPAPTAAPAIAKEPVPAQSYREYEARQQAAELARTPQQELRDRKIQTADSSNLRGVPPKGEPVTPGAGAGVSGSVEGRANKLKGSLEDQGTFKQALDDAEQRRKTDEGVAKSEFDRLADSPVDMGAGPALPDVEQGEFTPVWRTDPATSGPVLLLLRKVRIGAAELQQGCWLDWETLRLSLLESVHDLLPGASLVPLMNAEAVGPELLGRRLAGIAAELEPGPFPALGGAAWTPMRTTLVLTWVAVLLALVAIAAVLHAARDLAERRGRFVSAVTHELRTPLTTFCLYSQMLADGMVGDEASRTEYLGTLKRESQRLARIVENVLEFARLGRGGEPKRTERLTVPDLLSRLVPTLEQRAAQAGMSLVNQPITPETGEVALRVDPLTVERILFNLVDNACKYAADGARPTIELAVSGGRGTVEFSVIDHGHGFEPGLKSTIFRPFQRGVNLAHASIPGLGLGLALSRALARQVGGDLVLERSTGAGSRFTLTLPIERPRPA